MHFALVRQLLQLIQSPSHHYPLILHCYLTGLAVIGGRMLAARISEKTVALVGGTLFLLFAISSYVYGPDVDTE